MIYLKNLLKKWLKTWSKTSQIDNRLIKININRSSLLHNIEQFKKIKENNDVFPVLKSNAYGHGIIEISSILENNNVYRPKMIVVDSYFEALKLRNHGISCPMLIIGYVKAENVNNSKLENISYTISDIEILKLLKTKNRIHLKIDTGMHRQGILPEEIEESLEIILRNDLILEGICSHFADSDNIDESFTRKQILIWNTIVEKIKKTFPDIKYIHVSNTYGHRYLNDITNNSSRLGIGLYGISKIKDLNLKPVMEVTTIISGIKKIKKNECIGYGCSFVSNSDMTVATIPMGYYEGIDRRLSNVGYVEVNSKMCKILGKISMNITVIDVTNVNVKINDKVIVISKDIEKENSVTNIAKLCNTIPYEILVHIPQDLKRNLV